MISREQLKQFEALLRPIRNLVRNSIGRGVVTLVNNAAKMQLIQVEIQSGETRDNVEHFQPYGFKSVPKSGAESILVSVGGDRNTLVAVVTDDRRSRPTEWDEGDSGVYNASGASIRLMGSDVEVNPGPGGKVYVRTDGGSSEPLVTLSEHNAHLHGTGVGASTTPTTPATGTEVLEG